jgi:hypothetical protein
MSNRDFSPLPLKTNPLRFPHLRYRDATMNRLKHEDDYAKTVALPADKIPAPARGQRPNSKKTLASARPSKKPVKPNRG